MIAVKLPVGKRKGRYEEFMKLLSDDVISYFGRGIMLGIPNTGDLDDDDDKIKKEMAETIGIPENHVWIFKNYTLESHEEDVDRSIELLDFILHCLTVVKENKQFRNSQKKKKQNPNIQTENQQIPSIQTENQQIPNIKKENQQIPNIKKENQQIPNIQTENQQIPNVKKENQQIPNIKKENQQILNTQTENQQIPNKQTEDWGCNII
ncbi:uncharacterized protein LOC105436662 [Strongylocentrotus purpuratus]|uniref:Uncharacterized protein n=1 Tax=Strongylocentrotus purpuratus TaxID=7668 RepID=A0A7M7SVL1_STRPU|nr:uncharacterized protein LOC105436662 [Strongylocentrotus purpuratus]